MHFPTKVGHHPGQPSESTGEQPVEPDVADRLGDAGLADQIEKENDPFLLARVIVPASQKAAEDAHGRVAEVVEISGGGVGSEPC